MDIVDSQVHLGPGGINEMLAAMDALGIASVLIDEFWLGASGFMPSYLVAGGTVPRPVTPTAELASMTHPDRFSYIVRVDRRDPEFRGILRLARDASSARAIRVAPSLTQGELAAFASGDYDDLFSAASDCGLPIFVTIPGDAPLMRRYLEKFPDTKFVIDHCGMPVSAAIAKAMAAAGIGDRWDSPTAEQAKENSKAAVFEKVLSLADCPNVALKWAHAQGLFDVTGYPFPALRPFLRSALNSFGAERLMWASDIGANRTGESWAELLFWLKDNPDLSKSERDGVLGGRGPEMAELESVRDRWKLVPPGSLEF